MSGILFIIVLLRGQFGPIRVPEAYRFSVALHPPVRLPVALNSFGLWVTLMIALTIANYGFPIALVDRFAAGRGSRCLRGSRRDGE